MKYAFYKVFKVSSTDRKLFFEAWFLSFYIRWMLILFPFKKYSKKLGERSRESDNILENDKEIILNIARAIKRAVGYSLWRNKCLEQAITAKTMLKKRNINSTIYFGVRKPEDKLEAHAWLKVGDSFVVGQKNHETFTVVAYYS
jgi:hypothetical protein